jgi:hypothetical protein
VRLNYFWQEAKNKPLYIRLDLWNEIIEGQYSKLYDAIQWGDKTSGLSKKVELWGNFELYNAYADAIIKNSSSIEKEVDKARETYIREYPNTILNGSIYVMPLGPRRPMTTMMTSESEGNPKFIMLINSDTLSLKPKQMQNILINKLTHFHYISNPNTEINSTEGRISFARLLLISGLGEFNIAKLTNIDTDYKQGNVILNIHNEMKSELAKYNIKIFDIPRYTNYACDRDYHKSEMAHDFKCETIPAISLEYMKYLRKRYSYHEIFNLEEKDIQTSALNFLSVSPSYSKLKHIVELSKI